MDHTTTRQDGRSYIDEPLIETASDFEPPAAPSSSGSSVEEDPEDGVPIWDDNGSTDEGLVAEPDPSDEEDETWDVEDEDWELADGDFTKHYNRLRQHHAAVSTGSSKPPLPTRNVNVAPPSAKKMFNPSALTGGVATNPKAAAHDKDKSDRATQDQVLDGRTRLVLSGLVNRGVIGKMERCISTGKELIRANVYYAVSEIAVAIKIYRTSILNFRSRQAYIEGEHRFRGEYSSSKNPRKMIRVWAEKEFRNLRRLEQGGVRTPKVLDCKENVLVMEFLGMDGVASPRLKDAEIPEDKMATVYAEMIVAMRRMFQVCRLVHADLSEYNILYHDNHPYIIDVSQSVEHDHPRSYDFLRNDIRNVKEYFARQAGFPMLSLRRMWDFIVDENVSTGDTEAELLQIIQQWLDQPATDMDDDAVFMSSFIPRSLSEVYDPERDVEVVKAGKGDQLIYAGLTGLKETIKPDLVQIITEQVKSVRFQDAEEESEAHYDDDQAEDEDGAAGRPRGFRHEDRDAKKERKKAVKDEQRERRKQKMSKSEKQRLIKKSNR